MENPEMNNMVLSLILYVMLPLWGIAGFVDWCCHRATKIEENAGVKESFIHALMGIQVGIPIMLALLFEMNVLILLCCLVVLITHEVVAHNDVKYAAPLREISIWETHAHNYLATIPFYIFALVSIRNWDIFMDMITFNWSGGFYLTLRQDPVAGNLYFLPYYLTFMTCICFIPYAEEFWRCWRNRKKIVESK